MVFGETLAGKTPELLAALPASAGLATGYGDEADVFYTTRTPALVVNSTAFAALLTAVRGASDPPRVDLSTVLLHVEAEEPLAAGGYAAAYTRGVYTAAPGGGVVNLLLAAASFCPATTSSVSARVALAALDPACTPPRGPWVDACKPCFALTSPFSNAAALAGAVALVDVSTYTAAATRLLCADMPQALALAAQAAGARALLLRTSEGGAPPPPGRHLTPLPLALPTFSLSALQGAALVEDAQRNASVPQSVLLPSLSAGRGSPFFPPVAAQLGLSAAPVFDASRGAAADQPVAVCDLAQSTFQPAGAWPGTPAPNSSNPAAPFASATRLLAAAPTAACANRSTCGACLLQRHLRLATSGPLSGSNSTAFVLLAQLAALPCANASFSALTDAAAALGAAALVLVVGDEDAPAALDTLAGEQGYAAPIPTFGVSYACAHSLSTGQLATAPRDVQLPPLTAGVAPALAGAFLGTLGLVSGTGAAAALRTATLLADAALCGDGRCTAGQAVYSPTTAPAVTARVAPLVPAPACGSVLTCALCAALPVRERYVSAATGLALAPGRTPLAGTLALLPSRLLACKSLHGAAEEAANLGAVGVLYVSGAAALPPPTLASSSAVRRLTVPAWHMGAADGLALFRAAADPKATVRIRTPALDNAQAVVPPEWLNPGRVVDLGAADGTVVARDDNAAQAEAERMGTAVAAGLIGGGGGLMLLCCGGAVMWRRRAVRRRRDGGDFRAKVFVMPPHVELDKTLEPRTTAHSSSLLWTTQPSDGFAAAETQTPTRAQQLVRISQPGTDDR